MNMAHVPKVHHEGEMPLDHVSTFLRSALVRDPTSLGGLIQPEDVLKLEADYPALFDKPSRQSSAVSTAGAASQDENDNDHLPLQEKVVTLPEKPVTTTTALAPIPEVKKKIFRPPPMRRNIPAAAAVRKPSQFHRKCLEAAKPPEKMEKPVRIRASPRKPVDVKLTRPAQSFSMEDLRETLKQVVRKDPQQFVKSRKGKELQSPYTEDLVRMFLGRKLQELKTQQHQQQQRRQMRPLKGSQSQSHGQVKASDVQRKPQQIRSAPGFLRGFTDLPPAPSMRKKVAHSRSRYTSSNPFPGKIEGDSGNGNGESGKHVKWTEGTKKVEDDNEDDEGSPISSSYRRTHNHRDRTHSLGLGYGSSRQFTETEEGNDLDLEIESQPQPPESMSSGTVSPRKGDGRQIHLRSLKKGPVVVVPEVEKKMTSTSTTSGFVKDDRFPPSSFHRLAARSETGRLEAQARLRKEEMQTTFLAKEQERERLKPKRKPTSTNRYKFPSSSRKEKIFVDPEAVKLKTSRVLEKIAEELVYTEILHQLREIKQEKEAIKARGQNAETQTSDKSRSKITKSKTEQPPPEKSDGSFQECKSTSEYESESQKSSVRSKKHVIVSSSKSSNSSSVHRTPPSSKETTPRPISNPSRSPSAKKSSRNSSRSPSAKMSSRNISRKSRSPSAKMSSRNSSRKSSASSSPPSQSQPQRQLPQVREQEHAKSKSKSQSERSHSTLKNPSSMKTDSHKSASASSKMKSVELIPPPPPPQQNLNLETDCSEMSDFVLSEATTNRTGNDNKSNLHSPPRNKNVSIPIPVPVIPAPEETVKIVTPRLSQSFPLENDNKPATASHKQSEHEPTESQRFDQLASKISNCLRISKAITISHGESDKDSRSKSKSKSNEGSAKPETPRLSRSHHESPHEPEKDDEDEDHHSSTLSGVSTFKESQKSIPNSKAGEDNDKIPSKYSDDFIEENVSEESRTSHISPEEPELDDDDNDNDILNSSRETVIDLLSEGEFISSPYRSPGEVLVVKPNVRRNLLKLFSKLEDKTLSEGQRASNSRSAPSSSSAGRISISAGQHRPSAVEMVENNSVSMISGESEISHISSGAQVIDEGRRRRILRDASLSLGEYLMS